MSVQWLGLNRTSVILVHERLLVSVITYGISMMKVRATAAKIDPLRMGLSRCRMAALEINAVVDYRRLPSVKVS